MEIKEDTGEWVVQARDMRLRDYFAAKAMQSLLITSPSPNIARDAYTIADAMMRARDE